MKIIDAEKRICECCMEEHIVQRVRTMDSTVFKNIDIDFLAEYYYCDHAQETFEDEDMMSANDISMKNAYRKKTGLLTTDEIVSIRGKYGISQSHLCLLRGWGSKTIARYEGHQVQDHAHDTILRKLNADPEWFLSLLKSAQAALSPASFAKYEKIGAALFSEVQDEYLRRAILAKYAGFDDNPDYSGCRKLSLDRVVDMIRYFSNSKDVLSLYKVKLMKLLWYSDALSYKRRGISISGLIYQALPMGAVPIAHEAIIELSGVSCEEVEIGDGTAYKFVPSSKTNYPSLDEEEICILESVIHRFGKASKDEIVSTMHKEDAYRKTKPRNIIEFRLTKTLTLQ